MKIITYTATEGTGAVARILLGHTKTPKGKTVEDWHPVIFDAPSAATAASAAQEWWDAQMEKAAKPSRKAQPAAPVDADLGDVI